MKNAAILLIGLLLISLVGTVSAQDTDVAYSNASPLQVFLNNLAHSFNIGPFSVVGDSRSCGTTGGDYNQEWTIQSGGSFSKTVSETSSLCGSGGGLYDVFTQGWNKFMEYKDATNIYCSTGPCNIQLYCCPKKECKLPSDCSGGVCTTVDCTLISGTSGYKCPGEAMPYYTNYYSYCTTLATKTCYYKSGTICRTRTYTSSLFPNSCESYKYNSLPLYSTESACLSSACSPLWETGNWGPCSGGTQTRTVTDTNNCNVNTNKPKTSQSCTSGDGGDGGDGGGDGGNGDAGGDGGSLTSSKGDIRIIRENVKIELSSGYLNDAAIFKIPLKNYGGKEETINLEGGFYSPNYAKNIAELYSSFPLFSAVPTPNCNTYEEFVSTQQVTLSPGEEEIVELQVKPFSAFATYTVGKHDLKSEPLVYFFGLYKECLKGYINEAETTGKGIMFDYGEYPKGCSFKILGIGGANIMCGTKKIGTCSGNTLTISEKCEIPLTVDVVNGSISEDFILGDALTAGELSKVKKVSLTKEEISKSTTTQLLASACKLDTECLPRSKEVVVGEESLTYDVSCNSVANLRKEEVITPSKEEDMMSTGKKLVTTGVLGGAIGGAGGLVLCAAGVGAATVATGGLLLIPATATCASLIGASALVGAGVSVGTTLAFDSLKEDDELVKALKAGDSNGVGICTAEEPGTDIGALVCKVGKALPITKNCTYDGLIIIGGGLFLIFIFLNAGKKS